MSKADRLSAFAKLAKQKPVKTPVTTPDATTLSSPLDESGTTLSQGLTKLGVGNERTASPEDFTATLSQKSDNSEKENQNSQHSSNGKKRAKSEDCFDFDDENNEDQPSKRKVLCFAKSRKKNRKLNIRSYLNQESDISDQQPRSGSSDYDFEPPITSNPIPSQFVARKTKPTTSAISLLEKGNWKIYMEDVQYMFDTDSLGDALTSFSEKLYTEKRFHKFIQLHSKVLTLITVKHLKPATSSIPENFPVNETILFLYALSQSMEIDNETLPKILEVHEKYIGLLVVFFNIMSSNVAKGTVKNAILGKTKQSSEKLLISVLESLVLSDDFLKQDPREMEKLKPKIRPFYDSFSDQIWSIYERTKANETKETLLTCLCNLKKFDEKFDCLKSKKVDKIITAYCKSHTVKTSKPTRKVKSHGLEQIPFISALNTLVANNSIAASKLGTLESVLDYSFSTIQYSTDYQRLVVTYAFLSSLIYQSASNRIKFEENNSIVDFIVDFYVKNAKLVIDNEAKLGKDHQANHDESYDISLDADEEKMDENDQKQMKRVLNNAEFHLRSTVLAANAAILIGTCLSNNKRGKIKEVCEKKGVDYKSMALILNKFLDFMNLVQGITEDGKDLLEKLIQVFNSL